MPRMLKPGLAAAIVGKVCGKRRLAAESNSIYYQESAYIALCIREKPFDSTLYAPGNGPNLE